MQKRVLTSAEIIEIENSEQQHCPTNCDLPNWPCGCLGEKEVEDKLKKWQEFHKSRYEKLLTEIKKNEKLIEEKRKLQQKNYDDIQPKLKELNDEIEKLHEKRKILNGIVQKEKDVLSDTQRKLNEELQTINKVCFECMNILKDGYSNRIYVNGCVNCPQCALKFCECGIRFTETFFILSAQAYRTKYEAKRICSDECKKFNITDKSKLLVLNKKIKLFSNIII